MVKFYPLCDAITQIKIKEVNLNLPVTCYVSKKLSLTPHLWKLHICALGPRPPVLDLNCACQSFNWSSLVRHPIHSRKLRRGFAISPSLHCADREILRVHIFRPRDNSVVDCYRVIQVYVVHWDLYVNFFVRIKPVRWENNCLAVWIRPFRDVKDLNTAPSKWKT